MTVIFLLVRFVCHVRSFGRFNVLPSTVHSSRRAHTRAIVSVSSVRVCVRMRYNFVDRFQCVWQIPLAWTQRNWVPSFWMLAIRLLLCCARAFGIGACVKAHLHRKLTSALSIDFSSLMGNYQWLDRRELVCVLEAKWWICTLCCREWVRDATELPRFHGWQVRTADFC